MVSDAAWSRYLDDRGSLSAPCSYSSASLSLQGRSKFQRLSMLLELMANICSALFHVYYVVALLMALSQNYEHPYYALHLCYLGIFFSHRFLTTLPTWCSSVANVWKVNFSAVSTY